MEIFLGWLGFIGLSLLTVYIMGIPVGAIVTPTWVYNTSKPGDVPFGLVFLMILLGGVLWPMLLAWAVMDSYRRDMEEAEHIIDDLVRTRVRKIIEKEE